MNTNHDRSGNWIRETKRNLIIARGGHVCVYCGRDLSDAAIGANRSLRTIDHLVGGADGSHFGAENRAFNLVLACAVCNTTRRNMGNIPALQFAATFGQAAVQRVIKQASTLLPGLYSRDHDGWNGKVA